MAGMNALGQGKNAPRAEAPEPVLPARPEMSGTIPRKDGPGEFEFRHERFRASMDGVAVETGFLFRATESKSRYGIRYETKDGTYSFTYLVDGEPGGIAAVVPGEEHTLVISENRAMLVMGWRAAERGDEWINVDGEEVEDARAVSFELDVRFRGENFLSATSVHNDGMTTMFLINKDGLLAARGWSMDSVLYAERRFAPSDGWQLLSAEGIAVLVREGGTNAYLLSADFGTGAVGVRALPLPSPVRGEARIIIEGNTCNIYYEGGSASLGR